MPVHAVHRVAGNLTVEQGQLFLGGRCHTDMPDFPRQRPPASRTRSVGNALRYAVALGWILALAVSANAAMFWVLDRLLSR